jgi:DNA polymerase-3 subunit delta'
VPGQHDAAEFFRRAVETARLAHAYILVGPEGVGKRALARALAQFVFCEARTDDACGKCRACRLIAANQFADVHVYQRPEGSQQLLVKVVEQLQHEMGFKPLESDRKVFILEDADKMNAAGANKLLKVLEEPPDRSLLVLLALDVRDFLPTILSRCHVLRLRPLPADELAALLEKQHGCRPDEARYLSRFAMGSPGLAAELAAGNFFRERDWLIDLMLGLREGEHFGAGDELYKQSGSGGDTAQDRREALLRFIDVIALFYRDVLASALGSDAPVINADRGAQIASLGARLSPERARRLLEAIDEARAAIAFNANQKLLLQNLAFDVARLQGL